jgi:hypothetical protein
LINLVVQEVAVKINVVSNILAAVITLALLLVSVPVVATSGLTNGYAKIKDWDKAHQAFSFSSGQVVSSGGDFFIAPRGIHVFESPGIIDMGLIHLDAIGEAPASGYVEMTPTIGWTLSSMGFHGYIKPMAPGLSKAPLLMFSQLPRGKRVPAQQRAVLMNSTWLLTTS